MMDILPSQKSPLLDFARPVYRSVRFLYRKARAAKNRCLNLFDPPVVILIYHRVTDLPSDPEMIAVSPDNFRRHMEFLKKEHRILRFDEDWPRLEEPAVVVTFDDGYADNFLQALPILEEVEVPATFFVSTGGLGSGGEFWWHRLERILLSEGNFPPRFDLKDDCYGRSWDAGSREHRQDLYASLSQLMRRIGPARQEDWLDQLSTWAGSKHTHPEKEKGSRHRLMSREELKQLAENPWATIGAHTVSHSALSALSEAEQREEIFSSKQTLEEITGKKITTFSYPFGRKIEYNRISVRLCREAGFSRAAANFPGQVHRWTDPFQLPRHLVRNWDLETFAGEMKGFWTR